MILRHGILRVSRPCWLDRRKTIQLQFLSTTSSNNAAPPPKDVQPVAEHVRGLMREIPHPLTVIVAQEPNTGSPPAGLLVSSFNTVTLHPTPYVSFNLKLPSSTYDAIKASRTFTASAVADVQLAKAFLMDKKAEGYMKTMRSNVYDQRGGMLKPGRGAMWWMRCRWAEEKSQPVGDHVIVVGEVLGAEHYIRSLDEKARVSDKPLIYSEGKYRNAGPPVAEG
ncbi:MAG: hypothetical protein L6R38_009284 [Xanthoria sp. 2 TBL-2021]|nr:MAG: hypothetical protein L6R38_009284 [Xanthoria sp. 2 TBL-2021]